MKKIQYKNNNMKRIILIFLGLFSLAYAQYSPTGAKTQFKNGLGLGSKDSSAFLANDSLAITIDRNNRLLWRNNGSNGTWNVVAKVGATDFIINQSGSNLSAQTAKFRITDTGWINNVLRTNKALLDSIQASSSAGGYLVTNGGSAVMHWGGGGSVEVDFKGFAGYDANRSSSYTVRSFTDKRYVDSADALRLLISDTSTLLSQVVRTFGNQTISGKKTFTDSIVGANARLTGTLNATGQITSLSPIVSTDRGNGTTAFQSELSTSALNDSLIVMLGRSANGTYNIFDFVQYQRVANASTGGFSLNIYDAGGKQQIQKWERDSVIIGRRLNVRGQGSFIQTGVPIIANSTNSNTNKITFQDNGTDRGSIGASSTNALVASNSSGVAIFTINNSTAATTVSQNQNTTTEIAVTNTDNTNSTSRGRFIATGGTVTTLMSSIATLGGFIGTSSNHPLDFITNGSTRLTITTAGELISPVTYSNTIDEVNRTVLVDQFGEFGYTTSTRRSKTNINDLDTVGWLYKLRPVSFNYRKKDKFGNYTDTAGKVLQYGLIAEEVEPINDELIYYSSDSTGRKVEGVDYNKLITPLLKAVQDQKKEFEQEKAKRLLLEARIAALEEIINKIKP